MSSVQNRRHRFSEDAAAWRVLLAQASEAAPRGPALAMTVAKATGGRFSSADGVAWAWRSVGRRFAGDGIDAPAPAGWDLRFPIWRCRVFGSARS